MLDAAKEAILFIQKKERTSLDVDRKLVFTPTFRAFICRKETGT